MKRAMIAVVGSLLVVGGCGKGGEEGTDRADIIAVNFLRAVGTFKEQKARDRYGSREFRQTWSSYQWKRQARKFAARYGKLKQWRRVGGRFKGDAGQFFYRVKWDYGDGRFEMELCKEDGNWKIKSLMLMADDKEDGMLIDRPAPETQPVSPTTRTSTGPVGLPESWPSK